MPGLRRRWRRVLTLLALFLVSQVVWWTEPGALFVALDAISPWLRQPPCVRARLLRLSSIVCRTLAISCEGRTTSPPITMTFADDGASIRIRPPFVSCIDGMDSSCDLVGITCQSRCW